MDYSKTKLITVVLVILAIYGSANASKTEDKDGSSRSTRSIGIGNIARLIIGGNVPPDHPLVKYSDSDSNGKVIASVPGMTGPKTDFAPLPSYPRPAGNTQFGTVSSPGGQSYPPVQGASFNPPWQQNQGYNAPPHQHPQLPPQQAYPSGVNPSGNYHHAASNTNNAQVNPYSSPGNPYNAPYHGSGGSFGGPASTNGFGQPGYYGGGNSNNNPSNNINNGGFPQPGYNPQQYHGGSQPATAYNNPSPNFQSAQNNYPQQGNGPSPNYYTAQGTYSGPGNSHPNNNYAASSSYINSGPSSYPGHSPNNYNNPQNNFAPQNNNNNNNYNNNNYNANNFGSNPHAPPQNNYITPTNNNNNYYYSPPPNNQVYNNLQNNNNNNNYPNNYANNGPANNNNYNNYYSHPQNNNYNNNNAPSHVQGNYNNNNYNNDLNSNFNYNSGQNNNYNNQYSNSNNYPSQGNTGGKQNYNSNNNSNRYRGEYANSYDSNSFNGNTKSKTIIATPSPQKNPQYSTVGSSNTHVPGKSRYPSSSKLNSYKSSQSSKYSAPKRTQFRSSNDFEDYDDHQRTFSTKTLLSEDKQEHDPEAEADQDSETETSTSTVASNAKVNPHHSKDIRQHYIQHKSTASIASAITLPEKISAATQKTNVGGNDYAKDFRGLEIPKEKLSPATANANAQVTEGLDELLQSKSKSVDIVKSVPIFQASFVN